MIKKMRVRNLIGLFVATLGIYGLVWFAKTRNQIAREFKLSVPHWLWLILPPIIGIVLLVPLSLIVSGMGLTTERYVSIILGYFIVAFMIVFGISLYWIWKFGKAVERITSGKITAGWSIGYWIFAPFALVFVYQYYLNRTSTKSAVSSKLKNKPTRKFIVWSLVIFVVATLLSIGSYAVIPDEDSWSELFSSTKEIDQKTAEAEALLKQYYECVDELDATYPGDITEEQEDAYMSAYDNCEAIRVEQNEAADEQRRLIEEL